MSKTVRPVGNLLREWRQRRRLSQLQFACDAEISTKHLSFLETGRSQPSRDMVLRLAELLEVPLRERNALLVSAGFAPVFPERTLDDPAMSVARQAIDRVLKGHEPYPALAVDRYWNLVAANAAIGFMMDSVDSALLVPPINVLRTSLHPKGLAPRIANLSEWRTHVLARLKQQVDVSADAELEALYRELAGYSLPPGRASGDPRIEIVHEYSSMVVPLQLTTPAGILSFFSTTTMFGTPVEVTLSELAIEAFFPADAATAEALHAMTQASSTS